MKVPGLKRVRLAGRWLGSRFTGGVPILGFHRVADPPDDPYGLCVSRRNFAEQVEILRREAHPVRLKELASDPSSRELPKNAVVVTFDDGYADNLHNALPELERHDVPATIFVATGFLGGRFWWDELADALRQAPGEPARTWRDLEPILGDAASPGLNPRAPSKEILGALAGRLEQCTAAERKSFLQHLGQPRAATRDSADGDRALTEEELSRLAASTLIEIGSHTVSHVALAGLPAERQRIEIEASKGALEEMLGREVRSFAYPHGSVSTETVRLVQEAGFCCACSSLQDVARRADDSYRLPRFWIGDWDGDRFSRWLHHWS